MVDWSWAVLFGLTGVAMGLLTSFIGLKPKIEFPVWTAFYVLWIVIGLSLPIATLFATILVGSLVAGLLVGVVQATQLPRYRANNPWSADQIDANDRKARATFVAFGLGAGLAFGLVMAGIAYGLARLA